MTARIIAVLLTVTVVVLVALEVPLAVTFKQQRTTEATTALERDALAIGDYVEGSLERGDTVTIGTTVAAYQDQSGARAVIVDQAGLVVADSDPTTGVGTAIGRSFATRPEMISALAGETAIVTRRSDTLQETLLVVAAPIRAGGSVIGAVRVSRPRHELDEEVLRYWLALAAIGLVTVAVAVGLGLGVGRWATRALVDLQGVANELEKGDLDSRASVETGPPEVRDLAVRFNAMADRLSSLVRSSQDFAADASHQLRTPLTAVRLRLDNLAATQEDDPSIDAVLADIGRLERTIDALLAFTRIDREPIRQERLGAGASLRERAAAWAPAAEDGSIEIVVEDREAVGATILFDRNHLEQVLDNLIANALVAAPAGSQLELRGAREGEFVALHVTDHGPGLAAEDLERAFDRHWGLRPDGTGLGLAIVRRLCANNRATARLQATPGGGLDAVIVIPAAPATGGESGSA
jgi:signal transduction histidine kinase